MKKSAPIVIILIALLFVLLMPGLAYLVKNPRFDQFPFVVISGVFLTILYRICNFIFHQANNRVVKNKYGDVRLAWKIIILLCVTATLSVFIRSVIVVFVNPDIKEQIVLFASLGPSGANTFGWGGTIGGLIRTVSVIIATWFMVTKFERRSLSCDELCLDWRKSSAWYILFGVVLGFLFKLPVFLSSSDSFIRIFIGAASLDIMRATQLVLLVIPAAFSEEILCRAYFQNRLIERIGVPLGILAAAALFCFLHHRPINTIATVLVELSQLAIWCVAGYLFYKNRSLYFIGTMHSTMNMIVFLSNSP